MVTENKDGLIDELVYQLYRLTEEEIKIVEGKGTPPSSSPLAKGRNEVGFNYDKALQQKIRTGKTQKS